METILTVHGMHCTACEHLIAEILLDGGAHRAHADHETGRVTVEHEKGLTRAQMKTLLEEEGYQLL